MRAFTLALVLVLAARVRGLLVTPSSPQCASLCGNSLSSTQGDEITCQDAAYASALYGPTFEACVACELSSTYVDPVSNASDLQWALYNLRFALSWCLFGFDNNTQRADTPCVTSLSCEPLQASFEYDSLDPNATEYGFCPSYTDQGKFIYSCSGCLAETGNEFYLANFVTVLNAACLQQPPPGKTISIQGSVFSSRAVNITTPTPSPVGTYNPRSGGLTLDAKIGIAVGGFSVLLIASGCGIVWRGKRRRRRFLQEKAQERGYEWQAHHGHAQGGDVVGGGEAFFDSPQSQRPFANAWSHHGSPQSANPEKAYFSPYTSQYSSPVSAEEGPSRPFEWPRDQKPPVPVAEEQGERIEMTGLGVAKWTSREAPTLAQPRHGRSTSYDLTAEDAKAGNAL